MTSKQGTRNTNQTNEMKVNRNAKNEVELGNDFTIGNTKSQSQKKSGRQANKKKNS